MQMPERAFVASGRYRYGFNGKEIDRNICKTSAYDYGFRIFNPSIGRFLSTDPLFQSYPWYTPYQFAGNKPTIAIDLDGLEEKTVIHHLAVHPDGEGYVKSTEVAIDHNVRFISVDASTGKRTETAVTNVYYEYQGQVRFKGARIEQVVPGGMKPSAAYDYTNPISINQKLHDDAKYKGYNPIKKLKLGYRDLNAPDNAHVTDIQEMLSILATQAAAVAQLRQIQAQRAAANAASQSGTANRKPTTSSQAASEPEVPQKARDVVDHVQANNGSPKPGYKGGRTYSNDGRGEGQVLPRQDANGNPINYREYDVNPFQGHKQRS
ncbi:MAG: hypothetical protein EOO15_01595 [Chitinophagaceae bacterium]|nr:MAG: hypothetical protein EOO15_01595 [Chitinophagaceae bacterium]